MKTKNGIERSPITVVAYWRGEGKNASKTQATFKGHLTASGVERAMLFERQTPARRIESFEHKFN